MPLIFPPFRIPSRGGMEIFVKTLTGRVYSVKVDPTDSIGIVKIKLHKEVPYPPYLFRLVFNGKYVEDFTTLSENNIQPEDSLYLLASRQSNVCPNCKK